MKTRILVRYMLNPNFEPSGDNIATVKCTKITYSYPQIGMMPPGHVNAEPMRYSLYDEESGICVQIAGYQLIDTTYEQGWEEMVEEFRTAQMNMSEEIQEQMRNNLKNKNNDKNGNELPEEGVEYHA